MKLTQGGLLQAYKYQCCNTKVSSLWYLWKPSNPFPMGEKSNMVFCYWVLLKSTQQTWHCYFTSSKGEAITDCGLDLEMNPLTLGSGCLGGSDRPKYRSPVSLGHWFLSNSSLEVRMSQGVDTAFSLWKEMQLNDFIWANCNGTGLFTPC